MWGCPRCREESEDSFDVCWSCGLSRDGTEVPNFRRADQIDPKTIRETPSPRPPIDCLRCRMPLTYAGRKSFHEGARWGVLGELGELFVNKEQFDVYYCSRCGKVEFFVEGTGEELRPQ